MKTFLTGCLVLLSLFTFSEEKKEAKKILDASSLKFYGFIRTDFFLDTYKGVDALHEQFYLFPSYSADSKGNAINEQTSANIVPISSRLGLKVAGPEIFNAKTNACLEFDFAGKPSSTVFRIRHAYFTFGWDKSKLLVGQTWHPFWCGGIYPTTGSLNTGAPFQAFNRSPQVRYFHKFNKLTLSASAIYELQYKSRGPKGASENYARNAAIPEGVLSLEYKTGSWTAGTNASYKVIKPRLFTEVNDSKYIADETLGSKAFNGYVQYKRNKLMIKAKGTFGENMAHLLTPSGYGVKSYDATTGAEEYTPYQHASGLFNIVYGKKWQTGLFLGYMENLGTVDPLHQYNKLDEDKNIVLDSQGNPVLYATTFGLAQSIQKLYRVAPHVALNVSKLRLVAEYEMTSADYGKENINFNDGLYNNTVNATNHRILLSAVYFF